MWNNIVAFLLLKNRITVFWFVNSLSYELSDIYNNHVYQNPKLRKA